jgi:hypothetical protein
MNKRITVKFVNGKPTITTDGFSGDACLRATEGLERLLSGEGGVEVKEYTGGVTDTDKEYAD